MASAEVASQQPLIEYFPNYEKYVHRSGKIRLACEKSGLLSLPAGFPAEINSKMAWSRNTLEKDEWVVQLTPSYLKEIDEAQHHFQSELGGPQRIIGLGAD